MLITICPHPTGQGNFHVARKARNHQAAQNEQRVLCRGPDMPVMRGSLQQAGGVCLLS